MDVVTLGQAKMQMRVTNSAEDDLIQLYIKAATSYIKKYLNMTYLPGEHDSPVYIEPDVQSAALLIIAGMYEVREDKVVGQLNNITENPAVENLLYPYRQKIGF